jgi:hypothetical protein
MNIKPEDLVVGAELVCTRSTVSGYTVGNVYEVTKVLNHETVKLSSDVSHSALWGVNAICMSTSYYDDWHVQFELHNKPKTVHQWGGQFELEQEVLNDYEIKYQNSLYGTSTVTIKQQLRASLAISELERLMGSELVVTSVQILTNHKEDTMPTQVLNDYEIEYQNGLRKVKSITIKQQPSPSDAISLLQAYIGNVTVESIRMLNNQQEDSMTITTEQEIAKLEALTAELKIKLEGEQKAAPVPVSFKDTGELALALISGRTFLTPNDLILSCDVTREGSPFICAISPIDYNTTMDHTWDYFKDLREIPSEFSPKPTPWYLVKNFPFTRCYVSDSVSPPGKGCKVEFIAAFRLDRKRRFIDHDGAGWRYAVPVNNTTRGV